MNKWRLKTDWMGFEKGTKVEGLLTSSGTILRFCRNTLEFIDVSEDFARSYPHIFELVWARWVPRQNELFFALHISTAGPDIYSSEDWFWQVGRSIDAYKLLHNNVFKTKEQVDRAAEYCRTSGKDFLTSLKEFTDQEIEEGRLGPEEN